MLGLPPDRLLARLKNSAADMALVAGSRLEDFEHVESPATIILAWGASRDLLSHMLRMSPGLRWIHLMSAGFDHLLSPELAHTSAIVTNAKGVFSASLGEWVLGAILYFAKNFRRLIRSQAEGRWDPFDVVAITGQTVGIVGYGDIGRQTAMRCRAVGMRVLGLTRSGSAPGVPPDEYAEHIYGQEGLLSLIEQSDYVVVAAPLTPHTRGLIGKKEIAAMKPDAVLINVGRGPIIERDALLGALAAKRIKGAALDVFDREPLPPDDAFYALENVLLSPHCADHTAVWLDNALDLFLQNLQRYRTGASLVNIVDMARWPA